MKISLLCMIVLTACSSVYNQSGERSADSRDSLDMVETRPEAKATGLAAGATRALPEKYLKALACVFDENPLAAYRRTHETPAGRAERAEDLKALRALGFAREGRDGDLETVGGEIAAPPGMTLLGLPVRRIELNGMIGDVNAMYVTRFDAGVTADQVVKAARLELDRKLYDRYKSRQYNRLIGNNPYTNLSLSDRGGSEVVLVCHVQGTPH